MPSFDLVSKIDSMELMNALQTTEKVIAGRFDFKGSDAKVEWKEKENLIEIRAENETRVKAVLEILRSSMLKRGIGVRGMEESPVTPTGMQMHKMTLKLSNGISKDKSRIVQKLIKDAGGKVKAQYMDEKFRLESKSIDDLQAAFHMLKTSKELDLDLQMENMKR